MNTERERETLKIILENKGKASVQLVAKELKMRNDYIRYLCLELIKKGLVRRLKKRDWYKITRRGEKEIGKLTRKPPKKRIFAKKRRKRKKKIKKRAKKIKRPRMFPEKEVSEPETVPRGETKEPEVSKKIKPPTILKVNKITKALKNLFRIKEG